MLHHFWDPPIKTFQAKKWIDEYNVESCYTRLHFQTKELSFEANRNHWTNFNLLLASVGQLQGTILKLASITVKSIGVDAGTM